MANDELKLELITQEELLDGLLVITNRNMGFAYWLFEQVVDKTREEMEIVLQDVSDNFKAYKQRARSETTKKLNANMATNTQWHGEKPENTAAHHLAGWGDPLAEPILRILIRYGIPFDHEALGAFLPRGVKNTPHPAMPNARAHSEIHTKQYYRNVVYMVNVAAQIPGATREDIEEVFRIIGRRLQAGTFPLYKPIREA